MCVSVCVHVCLSLSLFCPLVSPIRNTPRGVPKGVLYRLVRAHLVLLGHGVDGLGDLGDLLPCLLYRGAAVHLPRPPVDVAHQLVVFALLLLDVLAQLADVRVRDRVVDELEPARLARPPLLVALLAEVAPPPVPAGPARLVEEAHCCRFLALAVAGVRDSLPRWRQGPGGGQAAARVAMVATRAHGRCVEGWARRRPVSYRLAG